MSPSRLQVGVLVLRLKSSASRRIPSCRCPRVGLWWATSHDTHQVPSRRGVVGSPPRQPRLALLSSFGRETSLVNIMGPRSIFPPLFTPSVYILFLLFSCNHHYHYLLR